MMYCTAEINNGLYILNMQLNSPTYAITNKWFKISETNETYLWHYYIRHINKTRISILLKNGYLNIFNPNSYDVYESYLLGRIPKSPFRGKEECATDLLGLIYSDVYGPIST